MLAVENLRVSYGRVPALHGISLHIAAGEAVALIGPNGAGKTTTLAAIFGLIQPAGGSIVFEGRPLKGAPEKIVQKGLALVPEGRHIFGTLTVGENLQLGSTTRRDRAALKSELDGVFERFPALQQHYGVSAGNLSGGEQQQLAIARALLSRPRLLLLDEPSLGLGPLVIDIVFETLEELRNEGVTILLVEQNAVRAVEFADRGYLLRSGQMVAYGTRDELQRMADFETAYLGA